ncbi:MAG: type II toxin-antitoxin system RatA family toxin [Bdellovibrionales bacterium]
MPSHSETRILPYTPSQLFDLVIAIERYPEFLPWCRRTRIRERSDGKIVSDMEIGYKLLSENFTSLVTAKRPRKIVVEYVSGPLSRLSNAWEFEPSGKTACKLSFTVDFEFRSPLMRVAMEMFFDKALSRMVTAFEARAKEIYGPPKKQPVRRNLAS